MLAAIYFLSVHDGGARIASPGRICEVFAVRAEPDGRGLDVIAGRVWEAVDDNDFLAIAPGYISCSFAVGAEDGRAHRNPFERLAFYSVQDDEVSGRAPRNIGDALAVWAESDLWIASALGKRLFGYIGIGLARAAIQDDGF